MHSSGRRGFSCHVLVVVNYWPSLLRSGAGAACTFPHGGSDRQDKINSIKDPTFPPPITLSPSRAPPSQSRGSQLRSSFFSGLRACACQDAQELYTL